MKDLRNLIREMLKEEIIREKGVNLYAVGPEVERIAQKYLDQVPEEFRRAREERDGTSNHHVTLIAAPEVKNVRIDQGLSNKGAKEWLKEFHAEAQDLPLDFVDVGLGGIPQDDPEVYFVILEWPSGAAAREKRGLTDKDFHITLGFREKDIHGVPKDSTTLIAK